MNSRRNHITALLFTLVLALTGSALLVYGIRAALEDNAWVKKCVLEVTAEMDDPEGDYYKTYGGTANRGGSVEHLMQNYRYEYGGREYFVVMTYDNPDVAYIPKQIPLRIDPEMPSNYVFADKRYRSSGEPKIWLGGVLIAGAAAMTVITVKLRKRSMY